jgi:ABC-2 type transport system permease protein
MKALWWSIQRELWEHGWLYRVPLVIGAIVISVFTGVAGVNAPGATIHAGRQLSSVFDLATRMILMAGTVTAYIYCAEALNGERRDRAILFWKSWPVGDGTTVAAKVLVATVVIPALTLLVLFVAQLAAGIVMTTKGLALDAPMANSGAAMLEVIAATLWIAPVYAWILLVSAWARRAVLLLAFLPPLLVTIVARMVGGEIDMSHALFYRGVGRHWPTNLTPGVGSSESMASRPATVLLQSPSLWIGVAIAGLLLIIVVGLRRRMLTGSPAA